MVADRRIASACLLAMLAAPVTARPAVRRTHPAWLVGTWDSQPLHQPRAHDCASGTDQVAYSKAGYWIGVAVGDYGRWWLSGDRLVAVALSPGDGGSPSERGHRSEVRIVRVRDGELRARSGGYQVRMRRCSMNPNGFFAKGVKH